VPGKFALPPALRELDEDWDVILYASSAVIVREKGVKAERLTPGSVSRS